MPPIKREEVSIKPLKKAETQFLRLWVPSYRVALADGTTNDFFDRFWLVWFDRFPLHFFPLEDPDCTKWRQNKMKEVSWKFMSYARRLTVCPESQGDTILAELHGEACQGANYWDSRRRTKAG